MNSLDARESIRQTREQLAFIPKIEMDGLLNRRKGTDRRPGKLFEIGLGVGFEFLFPNWAKGYDVYGLNGFRSTVKAGKNRLKEIVSPDNKIMTGTIQSVKFPDQYFKAVSLKWVIQLNTPDFMREILREIVRVLKPGGLFLCSLASENHARFGNGTVILNEGFENLELEEIRHFISQVQFLKMFRGFDFLGWSVINRQSISENWVVTGVFKLKKA